MDESKPIEKGLVQIQVVNYMNWKSTLACVESVREQTYDNRRLVVIENGSLDDSLQRLKEYDPNLSILASSANLGWGAGLNLGFFNHGFDTDPDFYLTVNSDAKLMPDCVSRLVETMQAYPNCAVTAPVIYQSPQSKRTNNTGFDLSYRYLLPLGSSRILDNHERWKTQGTREVSWVSDTVALMRRDAIRETGGYDESYFMYGQMTDMGYRLKQQGYELVVDYDAVAYHLGKGSSGGKLSEFSVYYKLRNWCLFQRKHFGKCHLPYLLIWSSAVLLLYSAKALLQQEPGLMGAMLRGIKDGLTFDMKGVQHHQQREGAAR